MFFLAISVQISSAICFSQSTETNFIQILDFPLKALNKINDHIENSQKKLIQFTEKSLAKFKKEENKIYKKLLTKDSIAAAEFLSNSRFQYSQLATQLMNGTIKTNKNGEYYSNLDSAQVGLEFVQANTNPELKTDIGKTLKNINGLQDRLKQVSVIQQYLKERRVLLKSYVTKIGIGKNIARLNKEAYYYAERISELKYIISDPKKLGLTAFRFLSKIPQFKDFFEKNSFIAKVFGTGNFSLPFATNANIPDIPGLQTRDQINQIVNSNIVNSAAGPNNQNILSEKLGDVKEQLNELKNRSASWDENSELPDFKPNQMKSKSFLQHLEFGSNLQFGKSNSFLPTTADIGAQLGYRFHQNGSFGLGIAYKLGFGNIRNLSLSHQGIGARSFLDFKLKKNIHINGGFEYNYNAAFKDIDQLRNFNLWQSSALIGISKKYKISKKIGGNLIVLYDFLHNQHIPKSQPILFRIGYNF